MGRIIAITNQKGGVGKTTTSINLAAGLGLLEKRVLLLDVDPQGNTTTGVGIQKENIQACMYDVMVDKKAVADIIIPDVMKNVDLAPATISLAGAEVFLIENRGDQQNILRKKLIALANDYDYILIDCPPSLGLINRNALACSDTVLIPIQAEYYALEGLAQLLSSIRFVQKMYNQNLTLEGILITMYDSRTNLSEEVRKEVRKYFSKKVYKTYIPRNIKLSEAPSYGVSIFDYDRSGKGAVAYRELAKEVVTING